MLVLPLLKFLLVACTAGGSRASRSHRRSVASDNQLEEFGTTTSPNQLPGENFSWTTSSAPFLITSEHTSTTSVVTTKVAPSPKTTTPTLQNSTKTNISLTTTVTTFTPTSRQTMTTTDFTTKSTTDFTTTITTTTTNNNYSTPVFTTEKEQITQCFFGKLGCHQRMRTSVICRNCLSRVFVRVNYRTISR
ncbi:hypothetical protein Baya_0466 [Bagarius yarrelli]|uniref:Uncharacterized protein n=1 Tax=Bagarius yarrelli TaxID=175774 RepID=A0A556TIC7_BAGYA|nr:hypothetical protein Baya_0466 [Bagarius yarrelli]